jgi:hypothetical protein
MNSKSILIDRLIFFRDRNLDTSDIESSIRLNFFDFLSDTKFKIFPIEILIRVLPSNIPSDQLDRFIEFGMLRLKLDGRIGSILFRDIDISRMSLNVIQELCEHAEFDWGFVGNSIHHTITDLMNECRKQNVRDRAECHERDRLMIETRQLVEVVEGRVCELESSQERLHEDIHEVQRTCELVLETIRTLSGAHSVRLSELQEWIRLVGEDVGRMKTDVTDEREAGRELRSRIEYLCETIERSDDRIFGSVNSIQREVSAGHSAIDALNDKFDKAERSASSDHDRLEKLIWNTNGSVIEGINAIKSHVWGLGVRVIPFSPQYELDGILTFLKRSHGSNIHDKGVVNVTTSSVEYCKPKNVADIKIQSTFHTTNNTSSEWVQYDFKGMKIRPSHYTLRSAYCWGVNSLHPKNWVIEVSATGRESDWTEIDHQTNNADSNGADKRKSFTISRSVGPVQFIRLRQTGPNHHGSNLIFLSDWELFGELHGHD